MRTGTERDATQVWRQAELRAAGFDEACARALAQTPGLDLHALLSLVDRGCPPPLAVRITASCDELAFAADRED